MTTIDHHLYAVNHFQHDRNMGLHVHRRYDSMVLTLNNLTCMNYYYNIRMYPQKCRYHFGIYPVCVYVSVSISVSEGVSKSESVRVSVRVSVSVRVRINKRFIVRVNVNE